MTQIEIKKRFALQARENGAECFLQIGGWNKATKKPDYTWWMISEKTGTHNVISNSNRMDERVKAHWEGFKTNQSGN